MVLEFLRVVAIAFRFAIRQLVILRKAFAERPSIIFDKVYLLWVGGGGYRSVLPPHKASAASQQPWTTMTLPFTQIKL